MPQDIKKSSSNRSGDDDDRQSSDRQRGLGRNKQGGSDAPRGFAAMDPERQREIASEGGRAAHEQGTAHEFDSEEAREAGRKSHQGSHSGQGRQGGGKQSVGKQGGSSGSAGPSGSSSSRDEGGGSNRGR